ncbi:MAG: efflux RND transporter periplasmic adaptor subunit [Chlorobiaceae bacterium]|nr:efflux RND transporter periplasmic adaptor subunit [Chlorobiaceae bacterium]
MRNKLLIGFAILGILLAIGSAYISGIPAKPQPPAFKPASNPYAKGIYANGIIETVQTSGENINVYPEVPGTVVKISVTEGEHVKAGTPLFILDDSVQRSTTASAKAQIDVAKATYTSLKAQYSKQKASWALDPRSVSKDALDTAENAVKGAKANLELTQKQYEAASALLGRYAVKALSDGTVLSINTAVGSYISSQGVYSTYTQVFQPVMVLGNMKGDLAVRCYIDEILINRIPAPSEIEARMTIQGTDVNIPLKFVRIQPNVTPKIELSSQRTERVDVRVLPVIFSFEKQKGVSIYPGQLVDVYIGEKNSTPKK